MRQLKAVMKKDLRDVFRVKAVYINIGVAVFLFVMLGQDVAKVITRLMGKGLPLDQIVGTAQPMVTSFVLMLALMLTLLFAMSISSYATVMEKTKRSLESLLCTPLGARKIWMGKSLTMFLPSTILGLAGAFLWLLGVNEVIIAPKLGAFLMTGTGPLLVILLAVPAIMFSISLLMTGLQLIMKHMSWINIISMGLIFGVGFGGAQSMQVDLNSWWGILIFFGIAAIFALFTFLLARFINPERIVLSSK